MFTIIDSTTGKVLFAKFDNEVLDGQVAIEQVCMIENSEGKDIYFNFETHDFYLQND